MRTHFIAIGGAAMHNLAIALHKLGHEIIGSDDEIFDPSKSRLAEHGLLPDSIGWNPSRINSDIDLVLLGMHAKKDNPELLRAQELNLKICSYPEYLYEHAKNKTRIVIGGSHGKTTITSMVLHVLKINEVNVDFMVGAQLEGFDTMVRLTHYNDFMILEGDEYLSSPIDRRPKFHLYQANIAVINGISWDHINVFPTYKNYVEQFETFIDSIVDGGLILYNQEDREATRIVQSSERTLKKIGYQIPEHHVENGITYLETEEGMIPLQIFGAYNLINLEAARWVCHQMGIMDSKFYYAISSFKGASLRMQKIAEINSLIVFKDFAHSPSKAKATIEAVRKQFMDKELIAIFELYTFSSLQVSFLKEYESCFDQADRAILYIDQETLVHKKLPLLDPFEIKNQIKNQKSVVCQELNCLEKEILSKKGSDAVVLLMSSGDFSGLDIYSLMKELEN